MCFSSKSILSTVNRLLTLFKYPFCGARSLVPTSGGGFALMGEGISLAGMTETPIVVVLSVLNKFWQRDPSFADSG
ncbi:MAG: hypothetical protein U5L00_06555 [Desulfovermiculus sp.]|nr:hypothetical protein [Desulfovermiculus sp.]